MRKNIFPFKISVMSKCKCKKYLRLVLKIIGCDGYPRQFLLFLPRKETCVYFWTNLTLVFSAIPAARRLRSPFECIARSIGFPLRLRHVPRPLATFSRCSLGNLIAYGDRRISATGATQAPILPIERCTSSILLLSS